MAAPGTRRRRWKNKKKELEEVLFSRHSGWVKMEAQVVMAVLILSWAKLFQRESKALPHCWRGCLSTIFPFVSSRSNPTLYFSFLSPPCHLSLRLQNSFMRSFSHYELTSLSPRSLFALSTSFLPSFLPSFFFFNLVSSPSSPLINSLIFFLLLPITVYRPDSCRSAVPGVFLCFFATRLAADGECLAELYLSRV